MQHVFQVKDHEERNQNGEILLYIKSTNLHSIMFSWTFEKQFNKLTGRKLHISYLSSVFLSIGMTVATLAMSGKLDEARLLLIAVTNGFNRKFDASFTSFVGILSVPDTFLVLRDFRIKFTSLEVTCLAEAKVLLELK